MAPDGLRIAYENWCWANYAPDWKDVWAIVKKVDRHNVGLCLDTFQSAGGEWADPTTKSGPVEDVPKDKAEQRWKESCQELAATIPAEKIFLLQISDAYKMEKPIANKADDTGLRPRGQWSHDYRPLPGDGGIFPSQTSRRLSLIRDSEGPFRWKCSMVKHRRSTMKWHRMLIKRCKPCRHYWMMLLRDNKGEAAQVKRRACVSKRR